MPEASLPNMKFRLNTVLTKTLCYKKNSYGMPKHRHRGNGQPTLNLTTLIDVHELPSVRISEKRDGLFPL